MARSVKALVEPALLIWARRTAAVDPADAAKAAGVGVDRLLAWERGDDLPTIGQLRRLAACYRRPLGVFFLAEPPVDFQALRDFRRFEAAAPRALSAALAYEIRAAQERRAVALDILERLGDPPEPPAIEAAVGTDPEAAAARVRARLGVGLDAQRRWRSTDTAFKTWRAAIEDAGIFVFVLGGAHHQVPLDELRGFALAERPLPAIAVNGRERGGGRVFTLWHELGHVALGVSALDDGAEVADALPAPARAIETFCNRFAAAGLMPRDAVLGDEMVAARGRGRHRWTDDEITGLASRFGVSREAMLLRLADLGLADRDFVDARRRAYAREYEAVSDAEPTGFAPHHFQVLGHVGRGFARLVLRGYHERRLTLSEVAGHLGLQAKRVPTVERVAFARAA